MMVKKQEKKRSFIFEKYNHVLNLTFLQKHTPTFVRETQQSNFLFRKNTQTMQLYTNNIYIYVFIYIYMNILLCKMDMSMKSF